MTVASEDRCATRAKPRRKEFYLGLIEKSQYFHGFFWKVRPAVRAIRAWLGQKTCNQLAECGQPGYFNGKVMALTNQTAGEPGEPAVTWHEVMR